MLGNAKKKIKVCFICSLKSFDWFVALLNSYQRIFV